MRLHFSRVSRRTAFAAGLAAALVASLVAPLGGTAAAGHGSDDGQQAETEPKADKAVVVPYETRPAPSHRVSLRDDRVYFLKKLEKTDNGFVLHTLEGETIEVEQSQVAEIVEFKSE